MFNACDLFVSVLFDVHGGRRKTNEHLWVEVSDESKSNTERHVRLLNLAKEKEPDRNSHSRNPVIHKFCVKY